jgi:uncharacterized Zn ribbon protein
MDGYTFTYDLNDIFKSIWGYTALPLPLREQFRAKENPEFEFDAGASRRETNLNGVPFYAKNSNGNEVFLPVWLIKPDNTKVLLANTVSELTNQKTIVETPLVNRKGTVKEEISVSDWIINIKGIIVSADESYPDDQVSELNELYELQTSLGIQNARTSLLLDGDEKVVIKSLKFKELKGVKNIQGFEMQLISDLAFTLIIE